jgi:3-oxoacyl-[acyl-carrier-protein] synthase II
MIGGSGAVEAIIAIESLRRGAVTPVAGLQNVDRRIAIDVVQERPREIDGQYALSNSFGFGGANTVLVLALA